MILTSSSCNDFFPLPGRACGLRARFRFPFLILWCVTFAIVPLHARGKSADSYGIGLSVSVPASEQELVQAVQDVVSDGIIQGSKEYNKDEYVAGAEAADSTPVFPKWTGSGQAFYKLRKNAL